MMDAVGTNVHRGHSGSYEHREQPPALKLERASGTSLSARTITQTQHARASHLDGLEIAPNATPGHRILPMEPVGRAAQAGFRRFTPAPAKTAVRFRRFSASEWLRAT